MHGTVVAALFPPMELRDGVEIAILSAVVYAFLRFLRRTVAGGVFRGTALLGWVGILTVFLLLRALKLDVLDFLLTRAFPVLILGLIVIFQPEFRHGLARLGETRLFRGFLKRRTASKAEEIRAVDEVMAAIGAFSKRKTGALIVFERTIDLSQYIDSGVRLDALVRAETLDTFFSTETILHDGAVILRGDRIAAAGCLLPLTERPHLARQYGTRHRAAIGLSEQSDAVVIVVSEETGNVHVAERGELQPYRDSEWLAAYLNVVLAEKQGVAPVAP
jgi:diadenylate cyclase